MFKHKKSKVCFIAAAPAQEYHNWIIGRNYFDFVKKQMVSREVVDQMYHTELGAFNSQHSEIWQISKAQWTKSKNFLLISDWLEMIHTNGFTKIKDVYIEDGKEALSIFGYYGEVKEKKEKNK